MYSVINTISALYVLKIFPRKKCCLYIGLLITGSLTLVSATAQKEYPLIRTPQNVIANTAMPKDALKPGEQLTASFSKDPTDEDIFRVHFLEIPLVPTKSKAEKTENADLIVALAKFSQRTVRDDFSAITDYLKAYPDTRWKLSLLANLGMMYRQTGWLSKAVETWEQTWKLGKKLTNGKLQDETNLVLGELISLHGSLADYERLDSLFKETKNRKVCGPAAEVIANVRAGYNVMKKVSGIDFRCGPIALNAIQECKGLKGITYNDFLKYKSSQQKKNDSAMHGMHDHSNMTMSHTKTSLVQLKEMSDIGKMNMQMAKRLSPNAKVIVPSIVHWKSDHFSALVKEEGGLYLIKDATFGQDLWVSKKVLDEEFTGYALVPKDSMAVGWKLVSNSEGVIILADECDPTARNNKSNTCYDNKAGGNGNNTVAGSKSQNKAMANYSFLTMLVSLRIQDNPVGYVPPKGPTAEFSIVYNQREAMNQPPYNYSNFGTQWTCNWLSYLMDDPGNDFSTVTLFTRSGGEFEFNNYNSSTKSYAAEQITQDVLVRCGNGCYELRHNDGSKETYARPDGSSGPKRKVFLTSITDAAGNADSIIYDVNLRIIAFKDALGQVTQISYGNSNDKYKITRITDPFKRFATFQYDGRNRLWKITDVIGITSTFQYDPVDTTFITQLITPYGITTFEGGDIPEGANTQGYRFLQATDPLGQKERLEMYLVNDSVNYSEPVVPVVTGESFYNSNLTWQNSYFWDKQAMKDYTHDFSKAHLYHWMGDLDYHNTSRILHSEKAPLENRIWYLYTNQPYGSLTINAGMLSTTRLIAQVTGNDPNTTTQAYELEYNVVGKLTKSTDPLDRQLSYRYDTTNIDLLSIRQTTNSANELLDTFTYNKQHLPLTAKDASGQTTNFTYNAAGQLTSIKNPRKERDTFFYSSKGYLDSIRGPVKGSTISFTYDGFGRIRTVTDPVGYKITTDYDALDRPTLITYPDTSFEQIVYNRLDPADFKDRLGRWSHIIYDKLRNPAVVQDGLGRVNQFIWKYGLLEEIADPLKHITIFTHDVRGRVVSKIYDDDKTVNYKYDSTAGRLMQVIDAKNQITNYAYYLDGNLKSIKYTKTVVPTDSVLFFYDSHYNRLDTMKDGTGTTPYIYKPITVTPSLGAGRLQKIDGPLSGNTDAISFTYDSLGRVSSRSINGVVSSVIYDPLGRVTSANNVLGNFIYKYVGVTNRLDSIVYPNGQSTVFKYFDNLSDQRLQEIWNKNGSTTFSKFDYQYNKEGEITKWTQQSGNSAVNYYELGYDLADQLISATLKNQSTNAVLKRYAYQYDKAGNRTSEQVNNSVTSATYNTLNQMTRQQDGGPMHFKGTLDEFGSVAIRNQTSSDSVNVLADSLNKAFEAFVKVIPGQNVISISATDSSGNNNEKDTTVSITVNHGINNTLKFDANGNTDTVTNPAVTYSWDAADRLVKITKGTNTIEFIYDGLSRRVAEKLNGTLIKRWIWYGTEICEERNATGTTVIKRFFPQGEQMGTTNYFFTRDHLGSVREVTDASSNLVARYEYDPYGRRTKLSGSVNADFGFTGHYFDSLSGLHLALYRAYDANLGRWLSRDPIGEREGPNLYKYANNNPMALVDPNGLWQVTVTFGAGLAGRITFGHNTETGQNNFGIHGGVGEGLSAEFSLANEEGENGWGWSGVAEGEIGLGGHLEGSVEVTGEDVTVEGTLAAGPVGGTKGFTQDRCGKITSKKFAFSLGAGESLFIGGGGNFFFPDPPPPEPIPPELREGAVDLGYGFTYYPKLDPGNAF